MQTTVSPNSAPSREEMRLMNVLATLDVFSEQSSPDPEASPSKSNVSPMLKTMFTEDGCHGTGELPESESPCGEHMSREGTWTFTADDQNKATPQVVSTCATTEHFGMQSQSLFHSSPAQLLQRNLPQYQHVAGKGRQQKAPPHGHQGQRQYQGAGVYNTDALNSQMLNAGCRRIPIHFNQQHPAISTHETSAVTEMMQVLRTNAAQTQIMFPPPQQSMSDRDTAQKVIHLSAQSAGLVDVDALAPTLELFIGQLPYHFDLLSVVLMVNRVIASIFTVAGQDADSTVLGLNIVTRIKQGPKPTCAFVEVMQPYAKILLRQSKRILCDQDGVWVATPQLRAVKESTSLLFSDLLRHLSLDGTHQQHTSFSTHQQQEASESDVKGLRASIQNSGLSASEVAKIENDGFSHFVISQSAVQALDNTTQERSSCQVKGIPHQAVVMEPATVRGTRQQQMANNRRAQQVMQQQQQNQIHEMYRHQQYRPIPHQQHLTDSSGDFEPSQRRFVPFQQQHLPSTPMFTLPNTEVQNGSSNGSSGMATPPQDSLGSGSFTVEGTSHSGKMPPTKNVMAMSNQDTLRFLQPSSPYVAMMSPENLSKMILGRAPATNMSVCPCGAAHVVTGAYSDCTCVMCNRYVVKGNVVRRCPQCEEQIMCPLCVATATVPLQFPHQAPPPHGRALAPPQMHLRVPPSQSGRGPRAHDGEMPATQFTTVGGSLWE